MSGPRGFHGHRKAPSVDLDSRSTCWTCRLDTHNPPGRGPGSELPSTLCNTETSREGLLVALPNRAAAEHSVRRQNELTSRCG